MQAKRCWLALGICFQRVCTVCCCLYRAICLLTQGRCRAVAGRRDGNLATTLALSRFPTCSGQHSGSRASLMQCAHVAPGKRPAGAGRMTCRCILAYLWYGQSFRASWCSKARASLEVPTTVEGRVWATALVFIGCPSFA